MNKKLRFGAFGVGGRGSGMLRPLLDSGVELVAVCDGRRDVADSCAAEYNCAAYYDFDEFIKHDMDGVMLTSSFHNHAQFAIKAMKAGKHVLCETISNVTMAEGVELCRVKEETGMKYALLENYPHLCPNSHIEEIYKSGKLGTLVYAEGEYVHPMNANDQNGCAPGERHWRNWTPRTFYTTHALAPLMQMTDARPTRVSAMASFHPEYAKGSAIRTGDAAAIIMCQTDTNAIFRISGWSIWAPHGNYYRLCGLKGGVETHTAGDVHLTYMPWCVPEGEEADQRYYWDWFETDLGKLAEGAGHGGADFFSIYVAVKAIEEGREPYWDVYRSTCTASVAILAWRSILNNNACYDVPDFRNEEERKKYENDRISPYPDKDFHADIPCSSQPYNPSEEDLAQAREFWEKNRAGVMVPLY